MVPLTTPTLNLLDRIERVEGNPKVIRSMKPGTHSPDLTYYWSRILAHAGVEGVRIHDLRHTCALKCNRGKSPGDFSFWGLIGIGGRLAAPPLPHHRAYGSVPRRFDRVNLERRHGVGGDRVSRKSGCAAPVGPPGGWTCARNPSANRRRPPH